MVPKTQTLNEIQAIFALKIVIGYLSKFPVLRMYWNATLEMGVFLEGMSRDRFV